jgi:hypothetical protein
MVRPCSCPTGASCSAGRQTDHRRPCPLLAFTAWHEAMRSGPSPYIFLHRGAPFFNLGCSCRSTEQLPRCFPGRAIRLRRLRVALTPSSTRPGPMTITVFRQAARSSPEMMRSAHLAVHMPRTPDRSSVPPCSGQSGQGPRVDRQDATALDRPCARRRRELRSVRKNARGADRTKEWTQLPHTISSSHQPLTIKRDFAAQPQSCARSR